MYQRPLSRVLVTVALAALGAGLAVPTAAEAAAPTRVNDRAVDIACSATGAGGEDVNFYVGTSELAGSVGAVQASTSDGEYLGRGEGTSDWTADSFRSSVEIYDLDDRAIGTAYLSGHFSLVGTPERYTSKFKDGNIRVVEDHSFTAVSVRDVTITFPGVELGDVSCDGSQVVGSLFFTNPTAHVGRDGGLVVQDCSMVNAEGFFLEGTLDALGVGLSYSDNPDYSAFSPEMDVSGGQWTGTFNAANDDGPIPVDAHVTLRQSGDTVKVKDSGKWGAERFVMTPYELVVHVDGPTAPAEVTCQLVDVDYRFRFMQN
jgi:Tfp pilus assembly protein FimT